MDRGLLIQPLSNPFPTSAVVLAGFRSAVSFEQSLGLSDRVNRRHVGLIAHKLVFLPDF